MANAAPLLMRVINLNAALVYKLSKLLSFLKLYSVILKYNINEVLAELIRR